jgi:putative transport protein
VDWFVETFRRYPELAIFLALAGGYWIGGLKIGKFSLGSVTGTLLAGVIIGQMQITISGNVKSVFFLLFLFAVGYGVGPQFFRGLKADGIPQVIFAVLQCLVSLFAAFGAARLLGYHAGLGAGLLSGSQTISAVLGVATDAINQLGIPDAEKKAMIDAMPIAYAVTYIFGTAGSAWILASIGPRLLGVDLAAECRKWEEQMGGGKASLEPGVVSGYQPFALRAFRVTSERLVNRSVADLERQAQAQGFRVFVERVRQGDTLVDTEPTTMIRPGDVVAVIARRELMVGAESKIGPEVDDKPLLDFPAETLDVVITNKALAGKTLADLAALEEARGVYLRTLTRAGLEMPFTPGTTVDRGDVLTLVGPHRHVERAARLLGYADRPTTMTDMVFVGAGIVLGGLVGAMAVRIGGIPLSLSTSGGALIAGLVFGWLRAVRRTFGRVPEPALWIMNSVGLNIFIAVVGISSGPGFVLGLRQAGLSLFVAGVVVTALPLIAGLLLGKYVFRFHPGITLGACAGARTTTAALGAIQDVARSKMPALGYTVTYAVGNTLLTIWGLAIVLLMA